MQPLNQKESINNVTYSSSLGGISANLTIAFYVRCATIVLGGNEDGRYFGFAE